MILLLTGSTLLAQYNAQNLKLESQVNINQFKFENLQLYPPGGLVPASPGGARLAADAGPRLLRDPLRAGSPVLRDGLRLADELRRQAPRGVR